MQIDIRVFLLGNFVEYIEYQILFEMDGINFPAFLW